MKPNFTLAARTDEIAAYFYSAAPPCDAGGKSLSSNLRDDLLAIGEMIAPMVRLLCKLLTGRMTSSA